MMINSPQFGYLKLLASPNEKAWALKAFQGERPQVTLKVGKKGEDWKNLSDFNAKYTQPVKTDFGYYLFTSQEWDTLTGWFKGLTNPQKTIVTLLSNVRHNFKGVTVGSHEVKQTGILTYGNKTLKLDNMSGEPTSAKF